MNQPKKHATINIKIVLDLAIPEWTDQDIINYINKFYDRQTKEFIITKW